MSKTYKFSKTRYEGLIQHLVDIEEKREEFLQDYDWDKQSEYKKIINSYINELDIVVKNTTVVEKNEDCPPFVLIGSKVEACDLDTKEKSVFFIVSPDMLFENEEDEIGKVSFLSPVGKALLLKKVNEEIEIKLPSRVLHYKIESIEFQ
ncbi:MAG: GreA/GreB family elongation factor [Peptococcales bacterium]|jgi:transcription elongation factor GreA